MKRGRFYDLGTVRSKTMALSKMAGGAIVLFYLITEEMPVNRDIGFWIWFVLLVGVIMAVDVLLGKLISAPLGRINETARQMAELDFSAHCDVDTGDEFGELSQSLNRMFSNLHSALNQLEAANTRLEKDVEQERILLAQRKELADSLSHEMKTPLSLIRAYAEGISEETEDKKKKRYVKGILDAAGRMDDMLAALLDLSALEAGAVKLTEERFDFVELGETVAGRLLLDAPETDDFFGAGGLRPIRYELPDERVFVRADRQRMEQALNNLIGNAKKYVQAGGDIRLSVCCEKEFVHFAVFNQCLPLKDEELARIWDKFYRSPDNKSKGSGLGLAITAQILSMYHVDYGVQNVGGGVEFFFCFPMVP